jgi:hypothetical protein
MLRERLRKDFLSRVKRFSISPFLISEIFISSILMDLTSETSSLCGFIGKMTVSVLRTSISPFIFLTSPENKTLVSNAKALTFAPDFPMFIRMA